MITRILTFTLLVVVAGMVVGASAFTTATMDRTVAADVVTDANGLLALTAGNAGYVSADADGALTIDFANGAADANVDAVFNIGDTSAAQTTQAFNITNNAGSNKDITLSYAVTGTDGNAAANVQFKVYDSSGVAVNAGANTASENSDMTFTATSGATYVVVVVIDTNGSSSADDLTGTLTISA